MATTNPAFIEEAPGVYVARDFDYEAVIAAIARKDRGWWEKFTAYFRKGAK